MSIFSIMFRNKEVNRQNEKLFDVVSNFANVHKDIYFEMGLLIGFQLYKGMEQRYKTYAENDVYNILMKQLFNLEKDDIRGTVLEKFFEVRANTVLEERLRKDKGYQRIRKERNRKMKKIDKIKLNNKQWQVVDDTLSVCNEEGFEYGRVAYSQGFTDAVKFFVKIF